MVPNIKFSSPSEKRNLALLRVGALQPIHITCKHPHDEESRANKFREFPLSGESSPLNNEKML